MNWRQADQTYLMSTYQRLPLVIAKAKGNYLYDINGNRYLDLFTGLAVNILGHNHPKIQKALHEQSQQFLHISNYFFNLPAIRLAKRLIQHSLQGGKVFFTNSGAEATEAAIKLIHKWQERHQHHKTGIVVVKNGFHGRTLGALRLTRQPAVYQNFPTIAIPVYEVTPNDQTELEQICSLYQPAAIFVEPILGSGGVQTLQPEYLKQIETLCRKQQMLFCVDEIQTGVGRTGKLFAYQHNQLQPDLILFAKGIGGGLPLGGMIVAEPHTTLFQPGDHGSTFAPSPLSAALGNAVLEVLLDDGQLEAGKEVASYLWNQLTQMIQAHPSFFAGMDGKGMMIGLRTHFSPKKAKDVQARLLQKGILIDVTAKTILRLLPPLTLTKEEVDHFVHQLESVVCEK